MAKFLQQKTNHLLDFIADRDDTANNPLLSILSSAGASAAVQRAASQQPGAAGPSGNGDDEDAAGESDDAMGEDDEAGKSADKQPPPSGHGDPNGRATPDAGASRDKRATSVGSASGDRRVNGKANGVAKSPPPFRPSFQANLDAPALIRTPYTMTHLQPVSLNEPGPSFSDKGKARDVLYGNAPPPWYPVSVTTDDEDAKLEGYWWGMTSKDDAYVGGLPAVPCMLEGPSQKRRRVSSRRQRSASPQANGNARPARFESAPPSLVPSKPVSLERVVQRGIDKMVDARQTMNIIQDWQRYYEGDGMGPPPPLLEPPEVERARLAEERTEGKRKRREARVEGAERRKQGGEVGEAEAALSLKRVTASMLAHSGFEGANEIPLDLFTRVAGDYLRNLGRTFRLLIDGFSHQMDSEEIVLHALHENGQIELQDLESHIKDDIGRETSKVAEMQRKVRQSYKELTTGPVIEDDMLFAQDGEMLQHGDFAEDLGEDFLGLRELGIDKEFGLNSLSVPKALFFGRRNRNNAAALGAKADEPDFPSPPQFISLTPGSYKNVTPALMHAFYAHRIEAGTGVDKDDAFDQVHATIGPLGQIVQKPLPGAAAAKKTQAKKDANGEEKKEKKPAKKPGYVQQLSYGRRACVADRHSQATWCRQGQLDPAVQGGTRAACGREKGRARATACRGGGVGAARGGGRRGRRRVECH